MSLIDTLTHLHFRKGDQFQTKYIKFKDVLTSDYRQNDGFCTDIRILQIKACTLLIVYKHQIITPVKGMDIIVYFKHSFAFHG